MDHPVLIRAEVRSSVRYQNPASTLPYSQGIRQRLPSQMLRATASSYGHLLSPSPLPLPPPYHHENSGRHQTVSQSQHSPRRLLPSPPDCTLFADPTVIRGSLSYADLLVGCPPLPQKPQLPQQLPVSCRFCYLLSGNHRNICVAGCVILSVHRQQHA